MYDDLIKSKPDLKQAFENWQKRWKKSTGEGNKRRNDWINRVSYLVRKELKK